jgi:hypothetical protein
LTDEYQFEEFDSDRISTAATDKLKTHRIPLGARFFHPSGFFGSIEGIYVNQDGRFQNVLTGQVSAGRDNFWILNASVGYRFPRRYGFLALDAANLLDENINFQDSEANNPRISYGRTIFGRIGVTF